MATKTKKAERDPLAGEKELAKFWGHKSGLDYTDFDAILGRPKPKGRESAVSLRPPARDFNNYSEATFKSQVAYVAGWIFDGYALSRAEFHLAVAVGLLLTDLPYVRFYKTRWFEDKHHRGYGKPPKGAS